MDVYVIAAGATYNYPAIEMIPIALFSSLNPNILPCKMDSQNQPSSRVSLHTPECTKQCILILRSSHLTKRISVSRAYTEKYQQEDICSSTS